MRDKDVMAYIFRFSKARVKYEPPVPTIASDEPIRYYPNGVRIIHRKESWRLQSEEWLAAGRFRGHYMLSSG